MASRACRIGYVFSLCGVVQIIAWSILRFCDALVVFWRILGTISPLILFKVVFTQYFQHARNNKKLDRFQIIHITALKHVPFYQNLRFLNSMSSTFGCFCDNDINLIKRDRFYSHTANFEILSYYFKISCVATKSDSTEVGKQVSSANF